ncbi:MAG: hypothetical protein JEZ06_05675 [Anaerolineaceae bacterium]|nr:hypothetical protein [Anaerolineaceae bacterium]
MEHITDLTLPLNRQLLFILDPHAAREQILKLTAHLAMQSEVTVLDGGNQFNAYTVAKSIRRRSRQLYEAMERINISRAFSCYQMVTMLKRVKPAGTPIVVLDLMATFYDENIALEESKRLLRTAGECLQSLSEVPVVVGLRPPRHSHDRLELLEIIQSYDAMFWAHEPAVPQENWQTPDLFQDN